MTALAEEWVHRAQDFERAANTILEKHEGAVSARVITVDLTYGAIKALNSRQDGFLRQSLQCIERGLNRPAQILAWIALFDLLLERLDSDGGAALLRERQKWVGKTLEDRLEGVTEFAVIEAAKSVGLLNKTEMKAFHGLLTRRNECAHPGGYNPNSNEALGYVSEVIQRASAIHSRVPA